ncbi:hypothetical protein [Streptomyces mirabilis]|uniref:hypothetical protein n=1 Tax=Streptomyces mirabilis TaxID=68239 RepID=UPI0036F431A0
MNRERTYDGLGRLIRETGTGAEKTTTDRTLQYDLAGRLTAIGTADGLTRNTYTYNDRGQLLTADGPGGVSNYAYNADGSMTLRKTTAGTTNYGYDSAGRIDWVWDSITNNDIWYDFDAAGRPRLEQYATKPDGASQYTATAKRTYGYDALPAISGARRTRDTWVSTPASRSTPAICSARTSADRERTCGTSQHAHVRRTSPSTVTAASRTTCTPTRAR